METDENVPTAVHPRKRSEPIRNACELNTVQPELGKLQSNNRGGVWEYDRGGKGNNCIAGRWYLEWWEAKLYGESRGVRRERAKE